MPITAGSRYSTARLQTVTGPGGDTRLEMRVPFPRSRTFSYSYYRTTSADRIDTLAHRFFGDGTQWWRIADANPEILEWMDLPLGTVLRIPSG